MGYSAEIVVPFPAAPTYPAVSEQIVNQAFSFITVYYAPQDFALFSGHGTSQPIAQVKAGDRMTIELSDPVDTLTVVYSTSPPLPNAVYAQAILQVSEQSVAFEGGIGQTVQLATFDTLGQTRVFAPMGSAVTSGAVYLAPSANRALVEVANSIGITGPVSVTGTVGVTGDVKVVNGSTSFLTNIAGVLHVADTALPTLQTNSYVAMGRNTVAPIMRTLVLAVGGNNLLTLWSPSGGARTVHVSRIAVAVESSSAAAILVFELRLLTTAAPTGGTDVGTNQTGGSYTSPYIFSPQSSLMIEPTALNVAVTVRFEELEYNLGITGAASVANPPTPVPWVDVYNWSQRRGQMLTFDSSVSNGVLLSVRSNAITTLKYMAQIEFTEEF